MSKLIVFRKLWLVLALFAMGTICLTAAPASAKHTNSTTRPAHHNHHGKHHRGHRGTTQPV